MAVYDKDPDATLDYGFDWSDWLANGETITTSSWTLVEGAGLTLSNQTNSTTRTTVWVAAGTSGWYRITNHITTSANRIDDRSHLIQVVAR